MKKLFYELIVNQNSSILKIIIASLILILLFVSINYSQFESSYLTKRAENISQISYIPYEGGLIRDLAKQNVIFQMSLLLIILSIVISGLAFAIGHSLGNYKIKAFVETEIKQAIANLLILLFGFGVLAFINTFVENFVVIEVNGQKIICNDLLKSQVEEKYKIYGVRKDNIDCGFTYSILYLERFYSYTYDLATIFISNSREAAKMASITTGKYSNLWAGLFFGTLVRKDAGYIFFSKRYQILFSHAINVLGFIRAQQFFLIVSYLYVAPLLFFVGILFRSFFLTRKLGGLLISVSLGIFIILPLLYILAWQMWSNTITPPNFGTTTGYCPVECTISAPFAYSYNPQNRELTLIYYSLSNTTPIPYNYEGVNKVNAYSLSQITVDNNNVIITLDQTNNRITIPRNMFVQCIKEGNYQISLQTTVSECFTGCPKECREIPYPHRNPLCQQFEKNCLRCDSYCFVYRFPTKVDYTKMPLGMREEESIKYSGTFSSNSYGFTYCQQNCYSKNGQNLCPEKCRTKYPPVYFNKNTHTILTNDAYKVPNFRYSTGLNDCTDDPNIFSEQNIDVKLTCPLGCRVNQTIEDPNKRPEQLYANCRLCSINFCPNKYRFTPPSNIYSCYDNSYSSCPQECRVKIIKANGNKEFISSACKQACQNTGLPDTCYNLLYDFTVSHVCEAIPANCKVNYNDAQFNLRQIFDRSTKFLEAQYGFNQIPYNYGSDVLKELVLHNGKTGDYFFGCELSVDYTRNYAKNNCQVKQLPVNNECKVYSGAKFMPGNLKADGTFESSVMQGNYSTLQNLIKSNTGVDILKTFPDNSENWTKVIQELKKLYDNLDGSGLTDAQKTAVKLAVENCNLCPAICRIKDLDKQQNQDLTFVCVEGKTVLCDQKYCSDNCKVSSGDNIIAPFDKEEKYVGKCLGCSFDCIAKADAYEQKCPDYCFNYVETARGFLPFCNIYQSKELTISDECEQCYTNCDISCTTIPPLRTNCNELCGEAEMSNAYDPNSIIDSQLSRSLANTNVPVDIGALSISYIPAFILPLFIIMLLLSGIRGMSAFIGGDIEIPGLGKII